MSEERTEMTKDTAKEQEKREQKAKRAPEDAKAAVSETWAEETIADLDEFIESQGIYIRQ